MVTAAQKTLVQDTFDSIAPIADDAAALCSIGVCVRRSIGVCVRRRDPIASYPMERAARGRLAPRDDGAGVPTVQCAAVETAVAAERLAEEL